MTIKTKLLWGFVLATVSVAMAGAASALPLRQLIVESGTASTVPIASLQRTLKLTWTVTGIGSALTLTLGLIAARAISGRLARFAREAEALAGTGQSAAAVQSRNGPAVHWLCRGAAGCAGVTLSLARAPG